MQAMNQESCFAGRIHVAGISYLNKSMKKTVLMAALMWAMAFAGWGQSKLSPCLRQALAGQSTDSGRQSVASLRQLPGTQGEEACVSAFITLNDAQGIDSLKLLGVKVRTVACKLLTASIPVDRVNDVAALQSVEYVEMGSPVKPQMDVAKGLAFVNQMQAGDGLPQGYDGEGVVIGFVDNGFDYAHPDFWNEDKTEYRIKRVWDQNVAGTPPEGYGYGNELDGQEEILSARYDEAGSGHGTHVMGIAAGADATGGHDFAGNAPGAEIVAVSLNTDGMYEGDNTAVIDGIQYIFNYAESVGKPCVVNLSLGSHLGPRDGMSSFDQMADVLQGPGRLIVGAVGNDGDGHCHVSQSFTSEAPDTLQTLFNFTYSYPPRMTMEVWGDEGMSFSFVPIAVSSTGELVAHYESAVIAPGNVADCQLELGGAVSGTITVHSEINPLNNRPHLYVEAWVDTSSNYAGFWIISQSDGAVHVWADNVYGSFSNYGLDGYMDGNGENTMGEIGGSGKRIVSVGAYVSRDTYFNWGIPYPSGETLSDCAGFSSRGPTPDGRIKPDISAPGSYIVSAVAGNDSGTPKELYVEWDGSRHYYGYMEGTSMSSPFVAGIMAAWLQVRPELTPEEAKQVLRQTAVNDAFTGDVREAGDNAWGFGKIDALSGLKECLKMNEGASLSSLQEESGAVVLRRDGGRFFVLFVQSLRDVSLSVYSMDGMHCAQAACREVAAGDEVELPLDGFMQGLYILKVVSPDGGSVSKKFAIK